jgi:MarR family transcriptional regulator, temperature-dependent positive regulator of motility
MQQRVKRAREIAASREADAEAPSAGLHPMVGVKLWRNPCWLSFRANYIAHHFNQPLYAWIGQRYKLTPPEHVVLYAVGLKDGITADDIAESSARPKNTLSRAVNSLIAKKLLFRTQDRADRRRLGLHLTRLGRRIVQETVPAFVAHEQAMASALTSAEQHTLNRLLTKIILRKANWPTAVQKESAS